MRFAPQHCIRHQPLTWRTCALLAVSLALAGVPLTGNVFARAQGASSGADPKTPAASATQSTVGKDSTATKSTASKPRRKHKPSKNNLAIVALVNDDPITGYEVEQRRRMMSLGKNINKQVKANFNRLIKDPKTTERLKAILNEIVKANPGKSQDKILKIFETRKRAYGLQLQKQAVASARNAILPSSKTALNELVDERLKLQAAKRLNALASEEDVNRVIAGMAKSNKVTPEQFAQQMSRMGANVEAMKERIKASLSWRNVISRQFGHQIRDATRGLDRILANVEGDDGVELRLHRILFALSGKVDPKRQALLLRDAELIRAKFKDCKGTSSLATGVAGARFQDLGQRASLSIPEPTRTLLWNAQDDEMLPATLSTAGVELWAVCGRKVIPAQEKERASAQNELQQKEFELMAKRHLKDLRQDAHIEYR